mmetsp:Transcript_924/g.1943  ORF Transcript_924/g.1943 Transcript_924/m.1943 type:complete len:207 (-) Transcript_924:76-696(-)
MTRKAARTRKSQSKKNKSQEEDTIMTDAAPAATADAAASSDNTGDGASADISRDDVLSKLPDNRFELELEFIQSLASPAYLHYLATSNYLTDPAFIAYLRYLQYWREPPYSRFITYPHCLAFLDLLLTNETFRRELATVPFRNFLHEQQFYSWQHRSRHLYGSGGNDDTKAKDGEDGQDGVIAATGTAVPAGGDVAATAASAPAGS